MKCRVRSYIFRFNLIIWWKFFPVPTLFNSQSNWLIMKKIILLCSFGKWNIFSINLFAYLYHLSNFIKLKKVHPFAWSSFIVLKGFPDQIKNFLSLNSNSSVVPLREIPTVCSSIWWKFSSLSSFPISSSILSSFLLIFRCFLFRLIHSVEYIRLDFFFSYIAVIPLKTMSSEAFVTMATNNDCALGAPPTLKKISILPNHRRFTAPREIVAKEV